MIYAGYKPNETASLGAITATGIDAITKINLEREKQDAARKVKQDALTYKAALEAQKEAKKEDAEKKKSLETITSDFSKNTGTTESSINLLNKAGTNMTGFLTAHPNEKYSKSLASQWSGLKQMTANIDKHKDVLAQNPDVSMQASFLFGRNAEKLDGNKLQPIAQLTADGNDAKLVLKDENGQTTTLDGFDVYGQKLKNKMPDLYGANGMFNSIVTQIGEIPNVQGRTTTTDVRTQENYKAKVAQAQDMVFADRENLGDVYYLATQKRGKVPIYYEEGDNQEELAAKAGVIKDNADFIKIESKNGVGVAKLDENQTKYLKSHIASELDSRVNVKKFTQQEHKTVNNITATLKNETLKGAGEIYNGVFKNDSHYIQLFKDAAQKNGDMLTGYQYKFPSEDPKIKDDVMTPVFQYTNGVIKYLHKDKAGVVVMKKIDVKKLGRVKAAQELASALSPATVKEMAEAGALTDQMEE
jgi:hypothetical protein